MDAAVWCNYKYLNSGPGSIGSLFLHENHSQVLREDSEVNFVNRLSGWWGSEKISRFAMDNVFNPISGAAGFQVSNPSILDITSVMASLEIFSKVCQWECQDQGKEQGISILRQKSVRLTQYLENGLKNMAKYREKLFYIITPSDLEKRGAQLSLKLQPGLLGAVMREFEERGIVVDERQPDVIRVAPVPLYNSFEDCWLFIEAFSEALEVAVRMKNGEIETKATKKLAEK